MCDNVANELLKDVIREVTEYRKLPLSGGLQERLLAYSQLTPVVADLAVCTCGENHYPEETECHQCGLPITPIR